MAIASNNMGRQQDAEKYVKQAIELVDGMTERERRALLRRRPNVTTWRNVLQVSVAV